MYEQIYRQDDVYGEPSAFLRRWLGAPAPGKRALDLGAGQGRNARYLLERGYEVVAVESSREALLHLARLPVTAEATDMRHFPFPESGFDLVVAVTALSALSEDDVERVFQGVARTLRQGGHFYLEDFTLDDPLEGPCAPMVRSRFDPVQLLARWSHWRLRHWAEEDGWDSRHPPVHRHVSLALLVEKP